MPTTFTLIGTATLSTAVASHTFSSIPATYTDLMLFIQGVNAVSGFGTLRLRANGDSGTNYSNVRNLAYSTALISQSGNNATAYEFGSWESNTSNPSNGIIHINSYADTSKWKTMLSETTNGETYVMNYAGTWRNTAAINSLTISNDGGVNLSVGSTFSLYGILRA